MSIIAWPPIASAVLAAIVCVIALRLILGTRIASFALDRPNDRSMHQRPTPRIGGLAILCGFAAALAWFRPELPLQLWVGLAVVFAVSIVDDLRSLGAALRLPLHLLAAGIAVWGAFPDAAWVVLATTTLLVGWMINLYNFMDGSDGLAGGQAAFGFGAYTLAALAGGDTALAVCAAAVVGSACGFLVYNFPPARIFMGDAGSTTLGLLAGALGAIGVARGLWSPLFPLIAFLPFVFDSSATLALRLVRGSRVWEAHREHAYQRLNLSGFGHRRTAFVYWALMALCAAIALATRDDGSLAIAVSMALGSFLYARVQFGWRRSSALNASTKETGNGPP
jgi:UDP-GlcNAc:undecaprenyl-phosphate GlcNAc-1-phosphate transferase